MSAAALNALEYLDELPFLPYQAANQGTVYPRPVLQGAQARPEGPVSQTRTANRELVESEGPTGNIPRHVSAASPDGE